MMLTAADSRQLILGDIETADAARGLNLDVISSVLIGLAAPFIIALLLDPTVLRHGRGIMLLILIAVFFISTILFAHSLLLPGDVRAVAFDTIARRAKLIRDGLFASNDLDIPFGLIKALRIEPVREGKTYGHGRALLVMTTREVIELPPGTTETHLAMIRRRTGLP